MKKGLLTKEQLVKMMGHFSNLEFQYRQVSNLFRILNKTDSLVGETINVF